MEDIDIVLKHCDDDDAKKYSCTESSDDRIACKETVPDVFIRRSLSDFWHYVIPIRVLSYDMSLLRCHFGNDFILETYMHSTKERIPQDKGGDKFTHVMDLVQNNVEKIRFVTPSNYYIISNNIACLSTCSGMI